MMEIPAASNVWWYVEVVQAEGIQLQVAYPGGCLSSNSCNTRTRASCYTRAYTHTCTYTNQPPAVTRCAICNRPTLMPDRSPNGTESSCPRAVSSPLCGVNPVCRLQEQESGEEGVGVTLQQPPLARLHGQVPVEGGSSPQHLGNP